MQRFPHKPILLALAVLFAGTVYVALSGTFQMYNHQGILSGPFSALVILGALELALLTVVLLDWRAWSPLRTARRRAVSEWLGHVLSSQCSGDDWTELAGSFRGREVRLTRTLAASPSVKYAMRVTGPTLRVVRLEQPTTAAASGPYDTGDAGFEERYAWQSADPDAALRILKQPGARDALKRLASLIADRERGPHKGGVALEGGMLSVTQTPAPWLSGTLFATPQEVLMILNDLSIVAAAAEGKAIETAAPAAPVAVQTESGGGWLAFGCMLLFWISIWLGITFLLGKYVNLATAMISFFLPPVILTFLFIAASAARQGRGAEIEDALRAETAAALQRNGDLAALAERLKVQA